MASSPRRSALQPVPPHFSGPPLWARERPHVPRRAQEHRSPLLLRKHEWTRAGNSKEPTCLQPGRAKRLHGQPLHVGSCLWKGPFQWEVRCICYSNSYFTARQKWATYIYTCLCLLRCPDYMDHWQTDEGPACQHPPYPPSTFPPPMSDLGGRRQMPSGFPRGLEWEKGRGLQMPKGKGNRAGCSHGSTHPPRGTPVWLGLEVEDAISQPRHSQGPRTQAEGTGRGDTEDQPVSCWPALVQT